MSCNRNAMPKKSTPLIASGKKHNPHFMPYTGLTKVVESHTTPAIVPPAPIKKRASTKVDVLSLCPKTAWNRHLRGMSRTRSGRSHHPQIMQP